MPPLEHDSHGLIDRSEIVDVRLQEVHAVCRVAPLPDSVEATIILRQPQYVVRGDRILMRFRHLVEFRSATGDDTDQSAAQQTSVLGDGDEPSENRVGTADTAEADPEVTGGSPPDAAVVIGEVRTAHVVELTFTGDEPSTDEIRAMIHNNVLFTVFPYVRAEVQRAAGSVGLPPVVLDFMRRPLPA